MSVTVNRYRYREVNTVESEIFRLTEALFGPIALPCGVSNPPENVVGVACQPNNKETGSIRPIKIDAHKLFNATVLPYFNKYHFLNKIFITQNQTTTTRSTTSNTDKGSINNN